MAKACLACTWGLWFFSLHCQEMRLIMAIMMQFKGISTVYVTCVARFL